MASINVAAQQLAAGMHEEINEKVKAAVDEVFKRRTFAIHSEGVFRQIAQEEIDKALREATRSGDYAMFDPTNAVKDIARKEVTKALKEMKEHDAKREERFPKYAANIAPMDGTPILACFRHVIQGTTSMVVAHYSNSLWWEDSTGANTAISGMNEILWWRPIND